MRDLPELFESLNRQPVRALFLAFDVNAPFFDHEVLPAILTEQLRDVTVIVDALGLRHGASDVAGTRKAGVYYRIESVRPIGGGLFHPKAIFLEHAGGVDVFVGSANLTWNGWCRNLEIVDALTFGENGESPASNALQLRDFLVALPQAVKGLSPAGARTMSMIAAAFERAATVSPKTAVRDTCEVLSSVLGPLLEQLIEIVPAMQIEQVVAISPFYDPTNHALLEVARAFSKARIVAVKEGLRANNFDGRSFSKLGSRAVLRQTTWESHPRPLHAKALFMNTEQEAWCAVGSANLTSPAWIRSAADGGNVELIIVRGLASGASRNAGASKARGLLADIPTVDIKDPATVQYAAGSAETDEDVLELHVLLAEEADYRLRIEWMLPAGRAITDFATVHVRTQDREVKADLGAKFDDGRWIVDLELTGRQWVALFDDEIAAVVHVQQETTKGMLAGAAWLRRKNLLGQGARALQLRHQLRSLGSLASGRPEDLLSGVAALLEAARTDEDAFALDETAGEDVGGSGIAHSGPRHRSALVQPIRALVMPRIERGQTSLRPSRVIASRAAGSSEEEDAADADEPVSPKTLAEARRDRAERLALTFSRLSEVLMGYVSRSLDNPTNERIVSATAGALLAGLRASAIALRQSWLADAAVAEDPELEVARAEIRSVRQRLWQMAFAIDGWELGTCPGWFPKMALTEAWPRLAAVSVQHPSAIGALLVDYASDLVRNHKDQVPAGVRFVLQRLSGVEFPLSPDSIVSYMSQLQEEGATEWQSNVEKVLSGLSNATVQDLPGWDRLRRWIPILEVARGQRDPLHAAQALEPDMLRVFGGLLRRPSISRHLVDIALSHGATMCGRCNTLLSAKAASALRTTGASLHVCEDCSGVLIPITISAPLSRWVLDGSIVSHHAPAEALV
jgi:hypothetical protein